MSGGELRYIRLLSPLQALDNPGILGKQVPWLTKLSVFASNTLQLNAEQEEFIAGRAVRRFSAGHGGHGALARWRWSCWTWPLGCKVLDLCAALG
ncbi:hypothetical protein BASA81_003635 [Batrachochytrium salamandrivorans]|nr:hypothetical protein BASA81_003635 [Batrachochytrium salamandrivorans]